MTTPDKIALASALVAALSMIANVAQAFWIHRLAARGAVREKLEDVLAALQSELHRSHLFDMSPHMEIWEFGFETLQSVSVLLSTAQVALERQADVPRSLYSAINDVAGRVKKLRAFRDSYTMFRHGNNESPVEVQKKWPDWNNSIRLLAELQPRVVRVKRRSRPFCRQRIRRHAKELRSRLTRGRTRRGPASARRPSRLAKSKPSRRHAACIARFKCGHAACRAAVATWALAARVNL